MVYQFFEKKSKDNGFKSAIKQNEQLVEELHKLVIRKFEKEKYIHHLKRILGVLI